MMKTGLPADERSGADRDESQDESGMWEAGLLEAALESDALRVAPVGAPEVAGYEVISWLGAGASGEVWLADELEPGRTVALKILHRGGAPGASVELMTREIRLMAQIVHPNLALLYHGVVTSDGRRGLAMEWIDGWPLDEWLQERPDLTLEEMLELFRGIVRGVAHLHDHGVIHRDLKPANVIVDTHSVPKIVDFGLARMHIQDTATDGSGGSIGVSGTLQFMAPEQAADGRGARAMPVDVYALGLIFHRMLLGKWLHSQEGTPAEILAKVLVPPPLNFHGAGRRLPRDLRSILRQALAPDPTNRYHHARDLEADLSRFSGKLPVAARKHTVVYLAATFLRRQARRSIVAAVLVLAGLVAGGAIYRRQRAVADRNEANLRYAYSLTSFTLRNLTSELRTGTPESDQAPTAAKLPGAVASSTPDLPLTASGELDLGYYQAMLADLRSATSESRGRYSAALKSIQPALDFYSKRALESPDDPRRLLDAAQARLSFARLLGRVGSPNAAGAEARKVLHQIDRLAVWKHFDAAPLPPMRCDALCLVARQAHEDGDTAGAVKLSREMLVACEALPAGLLVRPESETLPRIAVAAYDLTNYSIAAGVSSLPDTRREIDHATAICRAAQEKDPTSFPLACGLARCLHAQAMLAVEAGDNADLRPLLAEAANLLLTPPSTAARAAFSQIWDISVTATAWTGTTLDHPDITVPNDAVALAQRFTNFIFRNGIERQEMTLQRARIHLFRSKLACRGGDRKLAGRLVTSASSLLRPLQVQHPDHISLSLATASVMQQARSLADIPDARWNESSNTYLASLLHQLGQKVSEMSPAQRLEFASLR